MRDTEWKLASGTWQDAYACVGQEISSSAGVDPVNVVDIRRRLEVLAWDCPLHYDDAVARSAGYDGVVSPSTMVLAWTLPAYWRPGDSRPQLGDPVMMPPFPFPQIPAPGNALFATNCHTEFVRPMYPGDYIGSSSTLESMTMKDLSVGPGAFMVVRTTYTNQKSQVVAIERMTVFRYTAKAVPAALPTTTEEDYLAAAEAEIPPFSQQLTAADVNLGDELPAFSLPLTLQRLVMEAGVNRDFTPSHHDPELAIASGVSEPYANTALIHGVIEAAVRQWIGTHGRLKVLDVRMLRFNKIRQVMIVGGRVSKVDIRPVDPQNTGAATEEMYTDIEVEIWVTSGGGRSVEGRAIVSLPSDPSVTGDAGDRNLDEALT